MKATLFYYLLPILLLSCSTQTGKTLPVKMAEQTVYVQNKAPLAPTAYLELPLGDIRAAGWLKEQLERMATGMTGTLDSIYPEVVGSRNGWLGGDGDGWERGPYWIDGLLPLAYILDDKKLKAKVEPWVNWTLENQAESGYIGPIPFDDKPANEPGLQRGMRMDWWPKMVMLKVLKQYYGATQDERVIEVLTRYFKYQLRELPNRPLDDLTFWANRRGADNLQVVYWLYNITGDAFLLELGDIIQEQTFPWASVFANEADGTKAAEPYKFFSIKKYPFDTAQIDSLNLGQQGTIHTVNLAQGLKAPIIAYQKDQDPANIKAVKKALKDIKTHHGQPQGMYGGDEPLHGNAPVQGIEFCSISEKMFSLESMLQITGDMEFADLLEKITYNALPAQASDDFSSRQYFQAANQVQLTDALRTSYESKNHAGTDFVFGTVTGYPCCTTNMHQSWPKFVQNLFYATPEGGAAALLYAPSSATIKVADNAILNIKETTGFPFRETVDFEFGLSKTATFPFHLRIPNWTQNPTISVNGTTVDFKTVNGIAVLSRKWEDGDRVVLTLPMEVKASQWHKKATTIQHGPLVYALGIAGESKTKNRQDGYGEFTEVYPKEAWNFGLIKQDLAQIEKKVSVTIERWDGSYPWTMESTPISITIRGIQIPEWQLVESAPFFPELPDDYSYNATKDAGSPKLKLIPYGCTTLRISEFPTVSIKEIP